MKEEIERKFLVKSKDFLNLPHYSKHITQGYIVNSKETVVRIRISDDVGYITIKGETVGIKRKEWEKEIDIEQAKELMLFCKGGYLEKTRHYVDYRGFTFEVDEFHGKYEGLIVAEVELSDENMQIPLPDWIGEDVSSDPKYFNANMITNNKI